MLDFGKVERIELVDIRLAYLAMSSMVGRSVQLSCMLEAAGVSRESFLDEMDVHGLTFASMDAVDIEEVLHKVKRSKNAAATGTAGCIGSSGGGGGGSAAAGDSSGAG